MNMLVGWYGSTPFYYACARVRARGGSDDRRDGVPRPGPDARASREGEGVPPIAHRSRRREEDDVLDTAVLVERPLAARVAVAPTSSRRDGRRPRRSSGSDTVELLECSCERHGQPETAGREHAHRR